MKQKTSKSGPTPKATVNSAKPAKGGGRKSRSGTKAGQHVERPHSPAAQPIQEDTNEADEADMSANESDTGGDRLKRGPLPNAVKRQIEKLVTDFMDKLEAIQQESGCAYKKMQNFVVSNLNAKGFGMKENRALNCYNVFAMAHPGKLTLYNISNFLSEIANIGLPSDQISRRYNDIISAIPEEKRKDPQAKQDALKEYFEKAEVIRQSALEQAPNLHRTAKVMIEKFQSDVSYFLTKPENRLIFTYWLAIGSS